MISNIRSGIQKTGYKYILWSLLFIFIFSGTGLFVGFFSKNNTGIAAWINNDAITQVELRNKTYMFDQLLKNMGFPGDPQEYAFNDLVREKLLLGVADRLSLHELSPEYVANKISDPIFVMQHLGMLIPSTLYNASGILDYQGLHAYLQRRGMSLNQFEDEVESVLKQFFVTSLLPSTVFVSQSALQQAYNEENAQYVFKIVDIELNSYKTALQKEGTSEKELREYYEKQNAQQKKYWSAEVRSGTAWKFVSEKYGVGGDKFAARFSADARRIISQGDVNALAQFAQKHAAQKFTFEDIKLDETSPTVSKLFALKTPGKSGVVANAQEGYIVLLEAIKEPHNRTFESVKKEVEQDFYQEKALKMLADIAKEASSLSSTEAFSGFASEKKLSIRDLSVMGSDSNWKNIEKSGFPSARMKKMIHPGAVITHKTPKGISLIMVESRKISGSAQEIDATRKVELERKIRSQELQLMSAAFIASLQNSAKIEYVGM